MAGFATKLNSYMYEGEYINGTNDPIENGTLVSLAAGTGNQPKLVMKLANATSAVLMAVEQTEIFDGVPAYRFKVDTPVTNLYLVENQTEYNDSCEYDARFWKTPVGDFLRAHPLQVGDEFVVATTKTFTIGTKYKITNGVVVTA